MVMTNMTDLAVIVASRVKAEIFRLLFGLRRPELHFREIVRQSGLSLGTVQQELKGLTSVGLLKSRRDGNRVYFSANPHHPARSIRRETKRREELERRRAQAQANSQSYGHSH